jgi:serine/threonine-protein kinase
MGMRRKPSLKTGDIFQNQYEILGVLGAGGHAYVYRVYNQILAREQALKLIEISPDAGRDRRRRARMEAQALCRLRHPSVVGGEGAGVTEDGSIYILMELLRGPSLRAVLDEHRKLHLSEALLICAQIAEGVHEAHLLKIVHRDLKPENIIIEAGNRARVIDFGIAKFDAPDAQTTQRALVLGTTWYMSPEHIQGMTVTPRSDIFALATILYELVAGIRPNLVGLEVVEPNTINHRLLHVMPPYLDELVTNVPAEVADFVQKMLAKNPEDRPESMALVAEQLRAFAGRMCADEDAESAVRDFAFVTATQARRWEHEHTTRRAEPLRADALPLNIPDRATSQRALPIASIVHPVPDPDDAPVSAPADSPSQPAMRVSRIDAAPDDAGSSKQTLRFGSFATEHSSLSAGVNSANVVPNRSSPELAGYPDSERRSPTGPGYTRELPPPSTKKSRLAGVTSDPLWLRVAIAGVATGSLAAVVLVSAFLRLYRESHSETQSNASERAAHVASHTTNSRESSDPGMPLPSAAPAPSVTEATAQNLGVAERSFVNSLTPTSETIPQPTLTGSPSASSSSSSTPAKPQAKPARHVNATKSAPLTSTKAAAQLPAASAARPERLVTPDDWVMPSSGLSDESSKRSTSKASAKRATPAPKPQPPARDKDDRINLIFPPRQP